MNPIRPNPSPNLQPTAPARPADAARAAAQRAFFEIAMGKAPAAAAAAPVSAAQPVAAAPPRRVASPLPQGEAPSRPLRPGSLLDIRV